MWTNKVRKGFNTSDVPLELCLLQGEVTELFQAWRSGADNVGEELADVAIYLLGLAEMLKVDLEQEIIMKLEVNAQRRYVKQGDILVKSGPVDDTPRLRIVEEQSEDMLF